MMIGLAVGDALGWPQEQNSKNRGKRRSPTLEFHSWRRRSGTRFLPYDEEIAPGEYSDDTQLALCVARSLLRGPHWLAHFTAVELPAWASYQRGGGKSVLRAAQGWMRGQPPWHAGARKDRFAYFGTGANGVAMRVAPHVIYGHTRFTLGELRRQVVADGCATHGHPAAHVGALIHSYALRTALQLSETLAYGQLLDALHEGRDYWGAFDPDVFPEDWLMARSRLEAPPLQEQWDAVARDALHLLNLARRGVQRGALTSEEEVLSELGVFDRNVNGSGIVTAIAAAFLASRFAASPPQGLLTAAFLPDADTDTLASMTASILGGVAGVEPFGSLGRSVQDSSYIRNIAVSLSVSDPGRPDEAPRDRVTRSSTDRFAQTIVEAESDTTMHFVDGRVATLQGVAELAASESKHSALRARVHFDDGQTAYFTKVSKSAKRSTDEPTSESKAREFLRIGFRLKVSDLDKARIFYEEVLGLRPTKLSDTYVMYGQSLVIESGLQRDTLLVPETQSVLVLQLKEVRELHDEIVRSGHRVSEPFRKERGRDRFSCVDPDGHAIEVVAPER